MDWQWPDWLGWDAAAAIGTLTAAFVALLLGVRSERRATKESDRADRRLERQRADIEAARRREYLLDRLTALSEAYATYTALSGGPQSGEAGARIRALLAFLPNDYATLLRHLFQVDSRPEHEAYWRPHVPDDITRLPGAPHGTWIDKELAANIHNALTREV